ncbi:MAG: hypothetical protein HND58_10645 [Planctomycetota bacterium]|nr:MAG: hypothetical protein HND58_10645 [Planctomycetota bacterium]
MSINPHHPTQRRNVISVGTLLTAMLLVLAAFGCERRGIEEQTIEKGVERVPDAPAETGAGGTEAGSGVDASSRPWVVPDGWTEDPQPRQMRLATYLVSGPEGPQEVAVTRFAGRVGGELANINRWRGQMGLPAIGEPDLEAAIERFSSSGFDGYQARIESPSGVMLAAGVYESAIDQTWFLRATLPDAETADRLEADLFAMARSIAGIEREGGG